MRFSCGKYDHLYRSISEECKERMKIRLTRGKNMGQWLKGSSLILKCTKSKCGQPEYLEGSLI
jgi:hypothetical protein